MIKYVNGAAVPMTEAEQAEIMSGATDALWQMVRIERNGLLAACDWTQLPDSTISNAEAWAEYRQALRDITTQTDPTNITWPVAP